MAATQASETPFAPPRGARGFLRGALLTAGLALILNACGERATKVCPRVAVLNNTSSVTKMAPGLPVAPENAAFKLEMHDIKMTCTYGGGSLQELSANIDVKVTAIRGPKYTPGVAEADYFVVITDRSGAVLAKRTFKIRFDLKGRPNLTWTEGSWMSADLAQGTRSTGAAFEVWTGFQVSQAELEYNKRVQGR